MFSSLRLAINRVEGCTSFFLSLSFQIYKVKNQPFSMHGVWMACMLPYCSLWTRVKLHIMCNWIRKETSHRNIESCTLPQRCPINDVDVLTFLVGSPPNKSIMSLLPQGQSQSSCVVIQTNSPSSLTLMLDWIVRTYPTLITLP